MATVPTNKVPPLESKKSYLIQSFKERINKARDLPKINHVIGSLIAEEELTILFGRSGVGKTALAVQIGICVAKGRRLFSFLDNEAGPLKVLYYDAEMQDRQLLNRYDIDINLLPDNFDFMTPNWEGSYTSVTEQLNEVIDSYKFIIIDNLHTLGERLEESGNSRDLMMELKKIVVSKKVTLLVIAHTPNIPETCKMESSLMQGSEVLKVFLDQQIAIGNSILGEDTKYIKVLKSRNRRNDYHSSHVITTKLIKDNGYLKHDFQNFDNEALHYNEQEQKNKDIEAAVLNVQKQNPEFSTRKISELCKDAGVDVGKDKVNTILKNNGIELQKAGRKKN